MLPTNPPERQGVAGTARESAADVSCDLAHTPQRLTTAKQFGNHGPMDSTSAPKPPSEEVQPQGPAAQPAPPSEPKAEPAAAPPRPPAEPDRLPRPRVTHEFNVLCYTLLGLFLVTFGVWVIFAWTGYASRYATHADNWHKGGVRSIELTVVRDDAQNLSCASDVEVEGLHCAYRANQQPFGHIPPDDRVTLRPYNTVDSVLFLGAGLWSSPALAGPLPTERFTVVCNYRMVGAVKSVALRWSPTGTFSPTKDSLPVGILSDCVIPR